MVAASVANKTSETACIKFFALSVNISVASRSAAASGEGWGQNVTLRHTIRRSYTTIILCNLIRSQKHPRVKSSASTVNRNFPDTC